MKTNDLHPLHSGRTQAEWDKLIERYYDGLTNSQEEILLRAFLTSDVAAGPQYDAHRAVMSYLCLKKKYTNEETKTTSTLPLHPQGQARLKKLTYKWIAAAVAALCIGTTSVYYTLSKKEIYVAYVNGQKYTSSDVVDEETRRCLADVFGEDISVEQELSNIFSELEENENHE